MVKTRKIPLRKSVVSNEIIDKRDLLRIVKNKEGQVFIDPTGKANGRGAYIKLDNEEAIQEEKAKLVFLANDAASNLTKKVTDKGHYYEVQVSTVFSTLELSTAIGRARKVVAVVDAGFSKKMRSLME